MQRQTALEANSFKLSVFLDLAGGFSFVHLACCAIGHPFKARTPNCIVTSYTFSSRQHQPVNRLRADTSNSRKKHVQRSSTPPCCRQKVRPAAPVLSTSSTAHFDSTPAPHALRHPRSPPRTPDTHAGANSSDNRRRNSSNEGRLTSSCDAVCHEPVPR